MKIDVILWMVACTTVLLMGLACFIIVAEGGHGIMLLVGFVLTLAGVIGFAEELERGTND